MRLGEHTSILYFVTLVSLESLIGNDFAWLWNWSLAGPGGRMNTEELELLSDSKYRNYVAAIDKALKNFEYSSEWADLISALGKLNKVCLFHLFSKRSKTQISVYTSLHKFYLNLEVKNIKWNQTSAI